MNARPSRSPLSCALIAAGCLVVVGLAGGVAVTPALARGGATGAPAAESLAPEALIPAVGGLKLGEALDRLERAGFRAVRIEACSLELTSQIHREWGMEGSGRPDHVFQQSPKPGQRRRTDVVIMLRVRGETNHTRVVTLVPPSAARAPAGLPPPPPPPPERAPDGVPARAPAPTPVARDNEQAPAQPVRQPAGPQGGEPAFASGSPDAPRVAPPAQRGVVPTLLGLSLSDADQLVRDAGMTLHVDRVPGHPIGRVLEQAPSAGGRRPAAGLVRVVVTVGGDFEGGRAPGAPEVYLAKVVVPGLLDRTRLQAQRIIEDLGLRCQEQEAKRGLPGRVVDQAPASGGRVPKGGIVRIWIGPAQDKDAASKPAAQPRVPPEAQPRSQVPGGPSTTPGAEPEVPAPKPPLAPGTLPLGVPAPLAPGHGTVIPREEAVPIGFSWRGVTGAEAYLLEIEEEAAEGRWIANARKPARKTAVILDIERLQTRGSGRLRWRVSAVRNGRAGTPSRWVLLK